MTGREILRFTLTVLPWRQMVHSERHAGHAASNKKENTLSVSKGCFLQHKPARRQCHAAAPVRTPPSIVDSCPADAATRLSAPKARVTVAGPRGILTQLPCMMPAGDTIAQPPRIVKTFQREPAETRFFFTTAGKTAIIEERRAPGLPRR